VANFARQLDVRDVRIRFTGLRPGEKLHESLFSEDEDCLPTSHPRIFSAETLPVHEHFDALLLSLYDAARRNAADEVRRTLRAALPVYRPEPVVAVAVQASAPYPDDY